jgi:nitrate reductase gamma subunit
MNNLAKIRFWHLMVGTGFTLLAIGLVLIFLPPGVGDSEPFLIEFFEASIEGTEMGLALIVLGLSCFLIGRKDLADLRTYRGVQEDLSKTSLLTAKLVAGRVARTFNHLPAKPTNLRTLPDLDVEGTRRDLMNLQSGEIIEGDFSRMISQAERGLEMLDALEREGYSV